MLVSLGYYAVGLFGLLFVASNQRTCPNQIQFFLQSSKKDIKTSEEGQGGHV